MTNTTTKSTKATKVKDFPESDAAKAEVVKELPFYPVVIGDKTYKLCFDLDELDKAEEAFNREGHRVNMLFALDVGSMNLRSVKVLFAAGVRTFHPELGYEQARSLVTIGSIYVVTTAILNAFADAKDKEFDRLPTVDEAAVEQAAATIANQAVDAEEKGEGTSE